MIRTNHWQIAYKDQTSNKFKVIKNPKWGWCADPFLVEYKGDILLFSEIFLYKSERNGVIGYCKYNYEKKIFDEWKVAMDKHWHLSYPNVFVEDDTLYMCPESYQMEEVAIYRYDDERNEWIKDRVITKNDMLVDSTFLGYGNKKYMFTFKPTFKENYGELYCFDLENDKRSVISKNRRGARPGGNFFTHNNKLYRVGQNCENSYGESLIVFEVEQVNPIYREKEVYEITVNNINLEGRKKYIGIHTYNSLGGIEVVDLKYRGFSVCEYFARKRVKKVFLNKYK